MQPEQPYYQPTPAGPENTGQYDFILSHPPQKPAGFRRGGNTKTILAVAVGALVLIGLIWLILSLAFSGRGNSIAPLVGIAQQQTELVRVSKAATATQQLRTQDAQNFAATAELSLTTDQQAIVSLLAKSGQKPKTKVLALKQNAKTDAALDAAKANGTYDTTFLSLMQTQLQAYQATLQQTYGSATNKTEKQTLTKAYKNAQLLLELSSQRN